VAPKGARRLDAPFPHRSPYRAGGWCRDAGRSGGSGGAAAAAAALMIKPTRVPLCSLSSSLISASPFLLLSPERNCQSSETTAMFCSSTYNTDYFYAYSFERSRKPTSVMNFDLNI